MVLHLSPLSTTIKKKLPIHFFLSAIMRQPKNTFRECCFSTRVEKTRGFYLGFTPKERKVSRL